MDKSIIPGVLRLVSVFLCLNSVVIAEEVQSSQSCVKALQSKIAQAVNDIRSAQSALERTPLLDSEKIIASKVAMHALYYSKEFKNFALLLGVKAPEYGRQAPQIDFMDLNSEFVAYFLDFINAVQKNRSAVAEIAAWLRKVEISYTAHLDSAWKKEIVRTVDRTWDAGKFEPYKMNQPSKEKIFLKVLETIKKPEVLKGRILSLEKFDVGQSFEPIKVYAMNTKKEQGFANDFHQVLAEKLQIIYDVKAQVELLQMFNSRDEGWHASAMAAMRQHSAVIEWVAGQFEMLQASKKNSDLVFTLTRFVQNDLILKSESKFLASINPAAQNSREAFLDQKTSWLKSVKRLQSLPGSAQSAI